MVSFIRHFVSKGISMEFMSTVTNHFCKKYVVLNAFCTFKVVPCSDSYFDFRKRSMSYDDFLRWGCPTNCKLSQFNIPLCQVQVLPNLLQWYLGVRHRDSLQGQGRLILLFQTEGIRKCPSMNTLSSSSVWRPIRSRCVDIFNANSRQSQPVPADPSGQLQVFRRQVSSCSCHFILSPSL